MLRRGLSTLDELDVTEAKEAEKAAARDREIPAPGLDPFGPSSPGILDPSFWDSLDFSSEIP